ncbi:Protein TAR1 [Capsicum baccatum]|uniref:Protein TAR1 n=1 Tax=Capsicum baccatum TaxID=33114 RepID=A0A2G2VC84_CAPBA|nr:Protein TAR1 [Capsicum baccatum]
MCKCRSHGTFPVFSLQSSHLNICYYHQDLHQRPLRLGSRPRFCSDRPALLLIKAWHFPQQPGVGCALKRHPFLGLVDSAVLLRKNGQLGALDSVARLNQAAAPSYLFKVCSHSNPSKKIKVGWWCTPRGDPTNHLPCALRVYSPVDSHTCQTPWSIFQDGLNGEPTGQRSERADAEAHRRRALPSTIEKTAFHERIESSGFGRPPIHAGPCCKAIGGPTHRCSTFDRGASPAPIRFPPDNFKHSLTLFSKSFSSFTRGTFSLSVSLPYLALDGIHRPIWAAFPNNLTRRQRLVVRQGLGMTGLSPSPMPPSRGLTPGPPRQTFPQPNSFGRNLRSKTRWFMGFYNSHHVSHFATFFIDVRAEISIVESLFCL